MRPEIPSTSWTMLTVPGYTSSGPEHWQTLWERADPMIVRVEQQDWDNPEPAAWSSTLDAAIAGAAADSTILLGHSCGSVAIAHWVARYGRCVAGAVLVAPSDVERVDVPPAVAAFGPMPLFKLPFPTLVIASENDPCCAPDRARAFAEAWGSELVFVGRAGHLNTASGHGPWPEGKALVQRFCASLADARSSSAA